MIVSDQESAALWDYCTPEKLKDIDLILSCGDLKAEYLSFLVTMAGCPLLYVHGNHDAAYQYRPPEGCDCIDESLVAYRGIRIAGLGGCRRYSGGPHQYSEAEMQKKTLKLVRKIKRAGCVDIILTHCPAEGLGDSDDYAHRGFSCFRSLMETCKPRYFIHGHTHLNYNRRLQRTILHGDTTVINGYERFVLEIPDAVYDPRDKYEVIWGRRWNLPFLRKRY